MHKALVRVLVAEPHALFRGALAAALADDGEFHVVADAHDGRAAVAQATHLLPDVVLADAALAHFNGIEVCASVKSTTETVKVVVMSATEEPSTLLAAVEAGADGYITKDVELAALLDAVRQVGRGEAAVPPGMLGTLLRDLTARRRETGHVRQRYLRLTRREREVLELLVDGCDQETTADILVISPQTARTHIQNVITKLGVHSRIEAVALAREHGLSDPTEKGSRA